jgi:antitoxin ParD1/3/4
MTITLTAELEEFINAKVRSGAYKSADEVVVESLRLLKAKEDGTEALRREVMRGVEDIEQKRFTTYATAAELEAFSERLYVMAKVRRGLDVADREGATTQQEAEERLGERLKR